MRFSLVWFFKTFQKIFRAIYFNLFYYWDFYTWLMQFRILIVCGRKTAHFFEL